MVDKRTDEEICDDMFLRMSHQMFIPKHGTSERWEHCNCTDCRTNRVGRTLNLEEVAGAEEDDVEVVVPLKAHRGGSFARDETGGWNFDGEINVDGEWQSLGPWRMSKVASDALDRVREYWRRRALAEFEAAKVADLLSTALSAAREHARLFAAIADDGVFSIDRAQSFRSASAALGITIREIERCLNQYKVHGDVP
jgi:hypothetical protein